VIDPPQPPDRPVTPRPTPPVLPPQVQLANIRPKGDGFEVYQSEHSDLAGSTLTIKLAYEVSRGNPFAKYSPLDFDVATLSKTQAGCKIAFQAENTIQIEIEKSDFSLSCTGFDSLRDLEVRLELTKKAIVKGANDA
jgi:hypothetical protein